MTPDKAFTSRLTAAKNARRDVERDLRDILRFCDNGTQNDFNQNLTRRRDEPQNETFIAIGEEVATDLAGDLVNYFMPDEMRWAEYEVTMPIPRDQVRDVEALVQQQEDAFFALIESSNLNDVKPAIFFGAATHGTAAVWVDKGHFAEPLFVEAVPPDELYIVPGHLGVLDRFRTQIVLAEHLDALLGDDPLVEITDPGTISKMKKPGMAARVTHGFWVDWSEPGNPMWRRQITVDEKPVSGADIIGPLQGACPLLVGRFNPRPGRPWGRGPGRKALPDLLTLNKIEEVVLTKLDEAMDPAMTYVDDGVMDLANGIRAGMAYPRRSGSEKPEPILPEMRLDYGFYSKEEMQGRIRTAFYQDGPRQRGETPPTASQWLDERRRVQQRLGKPSAPLWSELILPMIQRIEAIGLQQGLLQSTLSHAGRDINIRAVSPLAKSQNLDEVSIARSNIDLVAQTGGPEAVGAFLDMPMTLSNIIRATGDNLTVVRDTPAEPPQGQGPS